MNTLFLCKVCGHIEFGKAPAKCPVCESDQTTFMEDPNAIHPAEKEGKEKHVPVILVSDSCGLIPGGCKDVHIKVGSVPHPMEAEHWITWIDVYINKVFTARYEMKPEALQAALGVHLKASQHGTFTAIEHCNKHGSWMSEVSL